MSQKKPHRRKYSSEEKAAILRRYLVDKQPVSDVCDAYGIAPSVFYSWQKQLVDNMALALNGGGGAQRLQGNAQQKALQEKVEALQARLAQKDSVIAEISEEYVQLKKELGEP
jgi:transposase-like protein